MAIFQQHDGRIRIGNLRMSVEEFSTLEPTFVPLAEGFSRRYDQDGRHMLTDGSTQTSGPEPWAEGDAYLAGEASYTAALVVLRAESLEE